MEAKEIKILTDKIDHIAQRAIEAVEAAKASAAVAYQASIENVKANKNLEFKLDSYIQQDNEWKQRAEPVIEMGQNVRGFGKVSLYILGFIASVTGAVFAILHFFNDKIK